MATATPKLVLDSIKDPKKQASQLQEQIQEQIHQFGDAISHKIEEKKIDIESYLGSSKSELKEILQVLLELDKKVENVDNVDFIHLMSIDEIGEQGHPFDAKVFDRINVELIPSTENKIDINGNRADDASHGLYHHHGQHRSFGRIQPWNERIVYGLAL